MHKSHSETGITGHKNTKLHFVYHLALPVKAFPFTRHMRFKTLFNKPSLPPWEKGLSLGFSVFYSTKCTLKRTYLLTSKINQWPQCEVSQRDNIEQINKENTDECRNCVTLYCLVVCIVQSHSVHWILISFCSCSRITTPVCLVNTIRSVASFNNGHVAHPVKALGPTRESDPIAASNPIWYLAKNWEKLAQFGSQTCIWSSGQIGSFDPFKIIYNTYHTDELYKQIEW